MEWVTQFKFYVTYSKMFEEVEQTTGQTSMLGNIINTVLDYHIYKISSNKILLICISFNNKTQLNPLKFWQCISEAV